MQIFCISNKGFKDKISGQRLNILPMSSALPYDVSKGNLDTEERDIFYQISCFEQVKTQLLNMLQMTMGLSKNSEAYNTLWDYNSKFCMFCGNKVTVCRQCEYGPLPPVATYCPKCGKKLKD